MPTSSLNHSTVMLHTDHFSFCFPCQVPATFLSYTRARTFFVFLVCQGPSPSSTDTLVQLPLNTYIYGLRQLFRARSLKNMYVLSVLFLLISVFDKSAFSDLSEIHALTQKTRAHIHTYRYTHTRAHAKAHTHKHTQTI